MDVQREKELEAIRRGEEITNAIHQFVLFHQGTKLPKSLDELVEGLPDGTRKRQILRPSSTTDPLTLDGRWRLIQPDPDTIARFAKRVQIFNNGILPSSPQPTRFYDRYTVTLANVLNTESATDPEDDEEDMTVEDNVPFIGVASQSRMQSVVTYYGIETTRNGSSLRYSAAPEPPASVRPTYGRRTLTRISDIKVELHRFHFDSSLTSPRPASSKPTLMPFAPFVHIETRLHSGLPVSMTRIILNKEAKWNCIRQR
jgi:hypothetical protein